MKIEIMTRAGKINNYAIQKAKDLAKEGITLLELDKIIEETICSAGGLPAFLNYRGYKHSSCLSVNNVITHGVPNNYKLVNGDTLKIDVGTSLDGYNVDSALMTTVGNEIISPHPIIALAKNLTLYIIDNLKAGMNAYSICEMASEQAEKHKYNIFSEFGGHFIGTAVHEKSILLNSTLISEQDKQNMRSIIFADGDTICVEPVITFGNASNYIIDLEDLWTVRSVDNEIAGHHEHTILIKQNKAEILS